MKPDTISQNDPHRPSAEADPATDGELSLDDLEAVVGGLSRPFVVDVPLAGAPAADVLATLTVKVSS